MVVAQLRGAKFEISTDSEGYIATGTSSTIAIKALEDVAKEFKFVTVDAYLDYLNMYGKKVLEKLGMEDYDMAP